MIKKIKYKYKSKSGINGERRNEMWNQSYLKIFVRSFKFRKSRGKNKHKKLISLNYNDERRTPFAKIPNFITCKSCNKLSKSSRNYRLTCDRCRINFRRYDKTFACAWQTWGD